MCDLFDDGDDSNGDEMYYENVGPAGLNERDRGCGVTQYFGLPCDNLEKLGSREFLSR